MYESEDPHKIVRVRFISEILRHSYGQYRHYAIDKAREGEGKGLWVIDDPKQERSGYNTRMMEADPLAMGYEGKDLHVNKEPSEDAVKLSDIWGPKEEAVRSPVKKKRVAWVQDRAIRGGAELSCELVVSVGRDLGFNLAVIDQRATPQGIAIILKEADAIILNNIRMFVGDQMRQIQKAIFSDRKTYVKYEHDHRELDRAEFSRPIFQRSAFNVFLSPVHLENHKKELGCDGVAMPLAIDVEKFKANGTPRKPGAAVISNVRNFKSWGILQGFITAHPEMSFEVLTDKDLPVSGENVSARGMVPPEEMPGVLGGYDTLVHLLDGWGAGERVVFEAALCGCRVIANENVGHMSWGKDLNNQEELRPWLRQAPFEFWKMVDAI